MKRILVFLAAAAFLCAAPALAAKKEAPLPDIASVETYLNGITTLESRFIQTDNDGKQTTGTFLLDRPGRMRFDYDPPVTDFIVADGMFIYYYDGQMKEQRSIPISKSLADFFLRKEMTLSGEINVSGMKRESGLLDVTLVQTSDPLAGSLTLMFEENPLQLKKWRIIDAQGLVTGVELYDVKLGIPLDKDLFHYHDPQHEKMFINK